MENKLVSFITITITVAATAAAASQADLERLDHLNKWQWTKDCEVRDAILRTDQIEKLSPGARAMYDKRLKAAVEGYDAWEAERQKHLASLTDEERKAYKAKCEKLVAEKQANDACRFEFDKRRAKEVAEKLALARQQFAAISTRGAAPEEPATSELLKLKVKRIEDFGEWANSHLHGLGREVESYKQLDDKASKDEREVAKFKIRLELWDMERDLNRVEMIKSTMSKEDLATYERIQKDKAELAKMMNPCRFERYEKSFMGQTELVKEAKTIIGL